MSRRSGTPRHPTAKVKGGWSPEEDGLLVSLVKKYGEGNWSPIARALNEATGKSDLTGRIGKQCRERWNHHLSPGLRKGPWTPEEEVMVVDAHKRLGNRWSDIARCIPGRSENAVKNHWNATLRKRVTPDNPAGPLKEYLDSLKLTVAPRRRNGGGGGGGGAGGGGGGTGTKRKRGSRERDDLTSADESDDDVDEEEEDDADAGSPADSAATAPGRGRGAALAPAEGKDAAKPVAKPTACRKDATASVRTPAGSAPAGAVTAAEPTAALGADAPAGSAAPRAPKGPTAAVQRFPSDGGAAATADCTTVYGGGTASGDTGRGEAAAAARRRRSKRVAALVGNERLRSMVEAEQREEAAEAAAQAAARAGQEAKAAAGGVLDTDPADLDGVCGGSGSGDVESVDAETGTEAARQAEAERGGDTPVWEMATAGEALQLEVPAEHVCTRPSRTESICESGLPYQFNRPFGGAPVVAGADAAPDALAAAAAPGPSVLSPFTRGASREVIAGAGLFCQARDAASTAAVADIDAATAPPAAAVSGVADACAAGGSLAATAPLRPTAAAACGRAAGPPLAHNWSTNNMQMLEAEERSRRASYGAGGGGKVRPGGCNGAARLASSHDVRGGGPAVGAGPRSDEVLAAAASPAAERRPCLDDDDLLLDTAMDFSGTMCLRHVASGSALFDYDARAAPDLTAVTAPPSPAVPPPQQLQVPVQQQHLQWQQQQQWQRQRERQQAAHQAPVSSPAPVPLPWPKPPQVQAPGRTWTPPDLFDQPHLDFGSPDSPLTAGAQVAPHEAVVGAAGAGDEGIQQQSSCVVSLDSGLFGPGLFPVPLAAPAAAAFVVDGGAADVGIRGVAANSSITSVGSPLSDVCEHGDSGPSGLDAARQLRAWPRATAAGGGGGSAAADHGAPPVFTEPASEGVAACSPVQHPGVVLKRESSFSGCSLLAPQQQQPPSAVPGTSAHPMAPFKPIAAPPPCLGPTAAGAQPTSPWTPVGTAPPAGAVVPQTLPTAPASPVPWGMPVQAGQVGGPMAMPYVIGAGPPPPPPFPPMPQLTASSGLSPPIICYGVPHLMSQHPIAAQPGMAATAAPPPPPPLPGMHALYGGAPMLHAGHPQPYQHPMMPPPYAVMHAFHPQPPAPPPCSGRQLDQTQQGAPSLQQQLQQQQPQPQQQQQAQPNLQAGYQQPLPGSYGDSLVPPPIMQQHQQQSAKPPEGMLYYVGHGYYYYHPGPYTSYVGMYNAAPYHAAGVHPAQLPVQMPVPPLHQEQQQQHPQQLQLRFDAVSPQSAPALSPQQQLPAGAGHCDAACSPVMADDTAGTCVADGVLSGIEAAAPLAVDAM